MSIRSTRPCFRRAALSLCVLLTLALVLLPSALADNSNDDDDGVPSLSEMDTYDALAIAFMVIGLAVSSAGGVGGGVIMVPAMVLIMSFDIKRATPISNVAILGGAVANAWFNLRKRHPTVDRPLIDPEPGSGHDPCGNRRHGVGCADQQTDSELHPVAAVRRGARRRRLTHDDEGHPPTQEGDGQN
ncbi:hypothetical protein ON010_g18315 [Phytophthora cinnamomi]|nr:hypothetical protein ON010_g18315 [Phytophthora cinnamomi]